MPFVSTPVASAYIYIYIYIIDPHNYMGTHLLVLLSEVIEGSSPIFSCQLLKDE